MTVAVKYCGGCNPRYDRSALLGCLRDQFPQAAFAGADFPSPDFVLVLTGCPAKCASHEHLDGRFGKLVIDSPADYERVADELERVCMALEET